MKDKIIVLEGTRSNTLGIWQANLTRNHDQLIIKQPLEALNTLAEISKPELAKWYHATLFRTVNKTLIQFINNGHFTTWPNITVDLMNHLPSYMDT